MAILNTKLLICIIAGLATIATTLAEIQKSQAERDAAIWRHLVTQQMVPGAPCTGLDWDAIDKRNKADMRALKEGFRNPPKIRFNRPMP
jgi:hypothetical protein